MPKRFVPRILKEVHRLIPDVSPLARCQRVVARDNIDQDDWNQEWVEAMLTFTKFTTLRIGIMNDRSSLT